jgi:hypothetical protein
VAVKVKLPPRPRIPRVQERKAWVVELLLSPEEAKRLNLIRRYGESLTLCAGCGIDATSYDSYGALHAAGCLHLAVLLTDVDVRRLRIGSPILDEIRAWKNNYHAGGTRICIPLSALRDPNSLAARAIHEEVKRLIEQAETGFPNLSYSRYRSALEELDPQYSVNLGKGRLLLLLRELAAVLAVAYFARASRYIVAREKTWRANLARHAKPWRFSF